MDGYSQPVSCAPRETLTMSAILDLVADEFRAPVAVLKGHSRLKPYAVPRQAYCWLSYKLGKWSTPQIGRTIDRDHTTVLWAIKMVRVRMESDAEFAAKVTKLWAQITSHGPQRAKQICPHCGGEVN